MERRLEMIDPMFGLRERNGKEEIETKGKGKMLVQVIYFSSNLAHFLFFSCFIQTAEKT